MADEQILAVKDADLQIIEMEKESARAVKAPRIPDWANITQLWRDRLPINRITQRQSVHIPLMKYGIQTILKDIDDEPQLYFNNLDNDEQKEIFYNEHWKEVARRQKLVLKDLSEKKNACLFGRAFKKLNIEDGQVTFEIIDHLDMLVHRLVDPADIDTAPCLIQVGIYKTLTSIIENTDYNAGERAKLKNFFSAEAGNLEAEENFEEALAKKERMSDLGVEDAFSPVLGETYVELNEVYRYEYDKKLQKSIIMFYIIAVTGNGDSYKLYKKPLHEHMGKKLDDNFWHNHFPYSSYGTDPERLDFWSDGVGDILRNLNNIIDSYASSLVENAILKNFAMTYYDSSDAAFVPQTFTPQPFGFYPVPGNPKEVMMPVEVGDLGNILEQIEFIIALAEKSIAATSTQTGETTSNVTLGDIQLALANAKERVKSIQTFVDESWKDFGLKYTKMLDAAGDLLDPVTVHKKGRMGIKMYTKQLSMKDWKSKAGYTCEVQMVQEKNAEIGNSLQVLGAAKLSMIGNIPLEDAYNKRLLEVANIPAEEQAVILEFQKQLRAQIAATGIDPNAPVEEDPENPNGAPQVPTLQGTPQANNGV